MTPADKSQVNSIYANGRSDYLRRLVFMTVMLNAVLIGAVYLILQDGKRQHELRAQSASENISKAAAHSVSDELEKIDLSLRSARDEIRDQLAGKGIDPARLNERLLQLERRLSNFSAIKMTDAKGIIRYGSGVDEASQIHIGQEDHFSYLRARPDDDAVIVKMKYCEITGKWVLLVARSYHELDGAFAGVIVGTVEVEQINRIFSRFDVGPHGFVTLHDGNDALIASHPKMQEGKFAGELTISPEFQALIEAGREGGNFGEVSPFDGLFHAISINKVGNWPLTVSAGMSSEDYLAAWRDAARNCILTAAAFSLLSVWMARLLYQKWKGKAQYLAMLIRNERLFRNLTEMCSDWIWEQDREFRFTYIVGNLANQNGIDGESLIGKTRWEAAIDTDDPKWAMHRSLLEAHQPFRDLEYECVDINGNKHSFLVNGAPVFGSDGIFQGYFGITKDITERKVYEERIRHMAQHDSLTRLPNRLMFYDRVGHAMRTARWKGTRFALFYIDLDSFKSVNDRFGHGVGDRVLMEVASRLQSKLRASDTLARLGGDEFALILPEIENVEDIRAVAQKLEDAMKEPFDRLDGREKILVGLSIGIAVFPLDSDNADDLIRAADDAMYRSKGNGSSYCFYSSEAELLLSAWPG